MDDVAVRVGEPVAEDVVDGALLCVELEGVAVGVNPDGVAENVDADDADCAADAVEMCVDVDKDVVVGLGVLAVSTLKLGDCVAVETSEGAVVAAMDATADSDAELEEDGDGSSELEEDGDASGELEEEAGSGVLDSDMLCGVIDGDED